MGKMPYKNKNLFFRLPGIPRMLEHRVVLSLLPVGHLNGLHQKYPKAVLFSLFCLQHELHIETADQHNV